MGEGGEDASWDGPPRVELSYTLEASDLTDAALAQVGPRVGMMLGLGLLVALPVFGRWVIAAGNGTALVVPVIVVIALFSALFVSPRLRFRGLPESDRSIHLVVAPDGIHTRSGVAESHLSWKSIAAITVGKRGALCKLSTGFSLFVPARALAEPEREALRAWAAYCAAPPRPSNARLLLVLWLVLVAFFVLLYRLLD